MEPVLPPYDSAARKWIEQAAVHIMKTKDADNTELRWYTKDPNRNFFLQDIKDSDWKTSEEARQKRQGRSYYLFIKHCLDREVDFKPVVEEKIRIEIDRSAKLGVPMDGIATVGGSSGSADGPAAAEGSANGAAAAGGGAAANGTNGATIGDTAKRKGDPDGGEQKFDVGTRVEVLGLQAKPEHNGKEGVVLSFVAESGRFKVQLDEHGGITTLALKPGNLMYATKQKKEGTSIVVAVRWLGIGWVVDVTRGSVPCLVGLCVFGSPVGSQHQFLHPLWRRTQRRNGSTLFQRTREWRSTV